MLEEWGLTCFSFARNKNVFFSYLIPASTIIVNILERKHKNNISSNDTSYISYDKNLQLKLTIF